MRRGLAALLVAALTLLPAAAAAPISIDARNTDLADVIALIARQSGLNIVADASVKPRRITFRLHDVDAGTALATLAQAYDLQTHRDGNIIFVSYGAATDTTAVSLLNTKPSEAVKELKGALPAASLVADDRSNTVVVSGTSDVQTAARSLLTGIDGPGRQVMFEVRVTDVKPVDDSSNVGLQFGGASFGTGALGQFPFALAKGTVEINAQINALVQSGHAQILATPRIATLNNREATLLVGETYPIVTVNQQTGFPTVTNVNVGVQLRLTPTIGADGAITAELHPEYSEIIGFNASFPIIANRKVDATLRVHDGQTIVLGGLFEDTSSETITKLPFLGDIPILGQFFRNKATARQRDEVVFLITPHLLEPSSAPPDE
ncbi:MAG TPA: secretin N-terminal domain-containing protein [Candidatus Lustribacter sp.]|jgi:type II secretory pathway component GspD/PulD (secretin)|nr:secretin N-terminal domain-containing protein [Candidatus Lustribacter sp.]